MTVGGLQAERLYTMAFPRIFAVPKIVIGVTYLAAYALLDWLSFIDPYAPFGITTISSACSISSTS